MLVQSHNTTKRMFVVTRFCYCLQLCYYLDGYILHRRVNVIDL